LKDDRVKEVANRQGLRGNGKRSAKDDRVTKGVRVSYEFLQVLNERVEASIVSGGGL
jgi:hypothetical protein